MLLSRMAISALLFLGGVAAVRAQTAPETPAPIVETKPVRLAAVSRAAEFVGTVIAIQQVDLRARVEGFLASVNFAEGSFVKAGDLLFVIEKDSYQAAQEGAQASLDAATASEAGAQATLKQAQLSLTRQIELLRTNAVSQSAVDNATATRDSSDAQVKQAQAQIAQAQSQLKAAELNLSYTNVTAPIAGRIGKTGITVGNLVSPSGGILATIVQTDPIRVVFSISDREYLQVVARLKPSDQGFAGDAAKFQPRLTLSDGTPYPVPGRISFINTAVDTSTGTIAVYAEFPNPDLQLVPGQYVSVTVEEGSAQQLPVVPATAVQQDQDGAYVFVLDAANHATIRRITLGVRVGTDWSVPTGLANGEIVIVSGIQKIKPGVVVEPRDATAGN